MILDNSNCQRCDEESFWLIMSRFNTEMIGECCVKIEKAHPEYAKACDAETAAVKRGHYNYQGIGLPADLKS